MSAPETPPGDAAETAAPPGGPVEDPRAAAREAAAAARALYAKPPEAGAPFPQGDTARRRELAEDVLRYLELADERAYDVGVEELVHVLAQVAPSWLSAWYADRRPEPPAPPVPPD